MSVLPCKAVEARGSRGKWLRRRPSAAHSAQDACFCYATVSNPIIMNVYRDIRREIEERMDRRNNFREKFITLDNLKAIWTRERIREVIGTVDSALSDDDVIYVLDNLLRTISILVYMR